MEKIILFLAVCFCLSSCKKECLTCISESTMTANIVGEQKICPNDSEYISAKRGSPVSDNHGSNMICY